jgi:cystathionine beta-lyase/cystathionine gamma-synthase
VNFRPLEHGYDIVIHSATKYLNGHSDLAAGAVIADEVTIEKVHKKIVHFGSHLDPHACFLLHRGLKTLPLRVRRQSHSALDLARFLEVHPRVNHVNYPGLNRHPGKALAERLMEGFGGMLSFELAGDQDDVTRFVEALTVPIHAVSLGGTETLIIQPALTSHVNLSPEEREAAGITVNLLRVSMGLESTDDLIADFQKALAA